MSAAAERIQPHVNELIEEMLPDVKRIALRLARRLPSSVPLEDLISAGFVGLVEATQRVDGRHAAASAAFIRRRIHGAMLDELRRRDPMTRQARTKWKAVQSAMHTTQSRLGRAPSEEELAGQLSIGVAELRTMLEEAAPVHVGGFDDWELGEPASDSPAVDEQVDRSRQVAAMVRALEQVDERTRLILHLYYVEGFTLGQIGEVIEVTESRVSQLVTASKARLRALIRGPSSSNEEVSHG